MSWLELERPVNVAMLVAVAAGAVATDAALRSGFVGVGGALLTLALAAAVLSGTPTNRQAWLLLAAVPLFGAWLALRTSPWLIPFDTLAVCGLLGLAASTARGGSLLDLGFVEAARRFLHAGLNVIAGLGYLWGGVRDAPPLAEETETETETGATAAAAPAGRSRQAAIIIGAALALPLVMALAALLSSADAVFASFFDLSTIVGHLLMLALGALLAAGLLRVTAAKQLAAAGPGVRWLGGLEAMIVLVAVDLVLAVFAAAQLTALSEGGRKIIETAGLTYAEYARSGFFQLVAAAGLTMAALLVLRAQTGRVKGRLALWVKVLSLVTVALTLSLVAVAVRRLDLYMAAYGLTTPRVIVFALNAWVGVVLALLGVAIAGAWRRRAWLGPAAVGTGLLVLLALNAVNPEALTMRYNAATGHLFDADRRLTEVPGTDGMPALAAALRHRPAGERLAASRSIECPSDAQVSAGARMDLPGDRGDRTFTYVDDAHARRFRGWVAFNLLREQAGDAHRELCGWRGRALPRW